MLEKKLTLTIQVYEDAAQMQDDEKQLIEEAKSAIGKAYAPYSGFKVGSAALLANGITLSAANQENASYPVCICSEVALLSTCSAMHPGVSIRKIAITTLSGTHTPDSPDSPKAPCGQCRQALLEFEVRSGSDIEIIMTGETGQVYKVTSVKDLLPLHFSATDL
jgi:cytidine deaminase